MEKVDDAQKNETVYLEDYDVVPESVNREVASEKSKIKEMLDEHKKKKKAQETDTIHSTGQFKETETESASTHIIYILRLSLKPAFT